MNAAPRRLGSRTLSTTDQPTEPTAPTRAPTEPPEAPPPRKRRTAARRPRYDQLVRKETRLRDDQADALARHARSLSRQAGRRRPRDLEPERITDNTLIRIAVDLLLTRAADLDGTTEAELRRSVGL